MPNSTAELGLKTALDTDDAADYETVYLSQSLTTIDGLFNQVSGHTHTGAHQGGPIGSGAFAAALDIPDWFRSTGHRSAYATQGAGIEMFYDGTNGILQSYDRGGSTWRPLYIKGSNLTFQISNQTLLTLDASGQHLFHADGTGGGWIRARAGTTGIEFVNNAYTSVTFTVDDSGNATVPGTLTANGQVTFNATQINGALTVGGTLTSNGATNVNALSCTTLNTNGQTITTGAINASGTLTCGAVNASGALSTTQATLTNGNLFIGPRHITGSADGVHVDWDFRIDANHDFFGHGIHLGNTGSENAMINGNSGQLDYYTPNGQSHRFFQVNTNWAQVQANNFSTQSSVEHARLYSKPVLPIDNAMEILGKLDPVHYFHILMKEDDTPLDADLTGYFSYGMSARQVAAVVPEAASGDFIDYDRLTAILWQAVKELSAQVRELKGATA